jgi:nitrate/TMAO reductase-like tetraheme cytochrome c subunit
MSETRASKEGLTNVRDQTSPHTIVTTTTCYIGAKLGLHLHAVLLLVSLCLLIVIVLDKHVSAEATASESSYSNESRSLQKYSRFSHSSPREHAALTVSSNCDSCHRRNDGSLEPRFPVHKDCIGCHLVQFTASNSSSSENPICTSCHTTDALNALSSLTKKFPGLRSFTADFDHAQHMQGIESARPAGGCATCHVPTRQGAAKTIPARLSAHQTCYQCHSPGKKAGNHSSCGSCHTLGPYSPTSTSARAYRMGFSHRDHDQRERLTCQNCHKLRGRGLPRTRQVSSILPAQHFANPRAQNCLTCHNAKRAFGDMDTHDCKRCHKRPGFRMGN